MPSKIVKRRRDRKGTGCFGKKEYEHLTNETVNKVGSYLLSNFSLISFQNDSVHSWSKRFGRKVQNS
ncbi:MAG: hypothetical protein ACP5NC_05840 [Nitrososphaeria archaeon]